MSRSIRHTPISGSWPCHTEKSWKTKRNRRLRHLVRLALLAGREPPSVRNLNTRDGFRPKDIDGFGDGRGKRWTGDRLVLGWPNKFLLK